MICLMTVLTGTCVDVDYAICISDDCQEKQLF